MLNLDTHILIHALDGSLTSAEMKILNEDSDWAISAIVLWEIEKLYEKGRIRFGLDAPMLTRALGRLHIWPITPEICLNLRRLDFKSDPADELMGATSLTHAIALVTRDRRIRATKLFPCLGG
jgi:PIN domain nuclease of toxin-antitoxin system